MRRLAFALLVLATLGFGISYASADTQIGGKRVALVIGNSAYKSVDRLANTANDARLIAATLQKLGFTLVGGGPQLDLDRAQLAQAVQDFGRVLAGADVGLFYYSGHGLQVQGVNWLVPVDANPNRPQDLDFQMVDADLVLRQMEGAGTRLNLVLLDACRNNPFANRGLRSLQGGLAEMRAPEGTLISYATQPGNVAADGTGANSPYTTALASSMQQPGLDIFRLFNQVGLEVKRSTGGSQQPWVSTSPIDGFFSFTGNAPPVHVAGLARPPAVSADALPRSRTLDGGESCTIPVGRIEAARGFRPNAPALDTLPPFACEVLNVLGSSVRQTRESLGKLIHLPTHEFAGELSFSLTEVGGPVRFDVFRPDGTVQHLAVRSLAGERGKERFQASLLAAPAAGSRLLVAFAGPEVAKLSGRPRSEPTHLYLAALRDALRSADTRADVALYEQRLVAMAARPVGAPVPTSSPRCSAVLQRAQLGEAMSDMDRAFVRAQCR